MSPMTVFTKEKPTARIDIVQIRERARRYVLEHGHRSRTERDSAERRAFVVGLTEAMGGCRRAQDRFARQLLPLLRATSMRELLARGMSASRARYLADDVANDVCIELLKDDARILRAWRAANTRHDPRAFFRTIARRRAIDAFRRDQRTIHCDPDDTAREPPPPPAAQPLAETIVMVHECLRRTIRRSRDAEATSLMIYDALVANARQADIACDLGISTDAVYQRTSRFRRDFASTWSRE